MTRREPATTTDPATPGAASHGTGLAAVLFDMDGTLVDSEEVWKAAEVEVAAALGGVWTSEDHRRSLGSATAAVRRLIELSGTSSGFAEILAMLNAAFGRRLVAGPPPRPGAAELVAEVAASTVPTALVTATGRALVGPVIQRLGLHHFDAVVTGDDVTHIKPHPEPYERAARLLGVDPTRCVAVEDSAVGAASAQAAGCLTVAVPHLVPLTPQPGRVVVRSLAELDLAALRALAADPAHAAANP